MQAENSGAVIALYHTTKPVIKQERGEAATSIPLKKGGRERDAALLSAVFQLQ
mgnify:CR=1 FL=1